MNLQVNDLVRILGAGGGFTIDAAAYPVDDLVRIAAAAAAGSRIHILHAGRLAAADLVRIAGAGAGTVTFDLTGA
jgi:dihydroorotase-like cyclic amidohydrolase